jgi:hypothetical protein
VRAGSCAPKDGSLIIRIPQVIAHAAELLVEKPGGVTDPACWPLDTLFLSKAAYCLQVLLQLGCSIDASISLCRAAGGSGEEESSHSSQCYVVATISGGVVQDNVRKLNNIGMGNLACNAVPQAEPQCRSTAGAASGPNHHVTLYCNAV